MHWTHYRTAPIRKYIPELMRYELIAFSEKKDFAGFSAATAKQEITARLVRELTGDPDATRLNLRGVAPYHEELVIY